MIHRYSSLASQSYGHFLKLLLVVGLLFVVFAPTTVQAGHLFTQATSNTPTWIQTGQGISID